MQAQLNHLNELQSSTIWGMVLSQLSKNMVNHLRCMLRTNQESRTNKHHLNLFDEIWWIWNLLLVSADSLLCMYWWTCPVWCACSWAHSLLWQSCGTVLVIIQADSCHHLVFVEQYFYLLRFGWFLLNEWMRPVCVIGYNLGWQPSWKR